MKYLIAGLGNIGDEYAGTRHNIGFDVADALVGSEATFSLDRHAHVATIKFKGRTLVVIKPTTYMNLSGKAVKYWMDAEKIQLERVFVVTDDLALPFGKIRIKKNGSDGGHNGLKSIFETLGTAEYPRMRFGIGDNFAKGYQSDYVLGKWSAEEKKALPEKIDRAVSAIQSLVTTGIERTMNFFN